MKTLLTRERQKALLSHLSRTGSSRIGAVSTESSPDVLQTFGNDSIFPVFINQSYSLLPGASGNSTHDLLNLQNSPPYGPAVNTHWLWQSVMYLAVGAAISLLASVLNIRDLFRLMRSRNTWSSTHVFLTGLACSDLLVAWMALPGFIVYKVNRNSWPLPANLCFIWLYVDWITTLTTSSLIMAVHISHIAAKFLPKIRSFPVAISHKGICFLVLICLILYANGLFLPIYIRERPAIRALLRSDSVCFIQTYQYNHWLLAYLICGCYFPAIAIALCCLTVCKKEVCDPEIRKGVHLALGGLHVKKDSLQDLVTAEAFRSRDSVDTDSVNDRPFQDGSRSHATPSHDVLDSSVITGLGVIFLICWMPGYVYDLLDTYGDYDNYSWHMAGFWLIYVGAALNPLAFHVPMLINMSVRYSHVFRRNLSSLGR